MCVEYISFLDLCTFITQQVYVQLVITHIIFHDAHLFFSILVPVCIVFVYTTEMSLRGADMTHKVPQKHEGNMDYNKTRTIQVAMQPSLPTLLNICKWFVGPVLWKSHFIFIEGKKEEIYSGNWAEHYWAETANGLTLLGTEYIRWIDVNTESYG